MKQDRSYSIQQISLVGIFLAILIICSKITVPTPAVQFTLQTLAVSMLSLYLGPRLGTLTITLFLILGLAGLPVFSAGGGLAYLLKPSFGYLVAFIPAVYVTGKLFQKNIAKKTNVLFLSALLSSLAGLLLIHTVGTTYFYVLGYFYLGLRAKSWTWFAISGSLLFLPTDLIQIAASALIVSRVHAFRPAWLKSASS